MLCLKLGWLSSSGEFIECGTYEHVSIAHELVDKLPCRSPAELRKADDDILIDNGWVHIGISAFSHKYVIWWNHKTLLSSEQRNFLIPYFEDRDNVEMMCLSNWDTDNR